MHAIPLRLAALGTILAGFAAAAGLIVPALYVDAPNWVQQARGTDLATLFLAVPVLGAGLWTAARGSAAGRLAVTAGLLYLVYNYAIFAFAVAMNPLTAVHIAILGSALWSLVLAGPVAAETGDQVSKRLHRRTVGSLLVGVAVLFGLLWLGQIATASTTGTLPPDLVKAGIATNPVYALDLAFFLPMCAVAGFALWRRTSAAVYALPMLIWVALMGAGVVGGFGFIAASGDAVPMPVVITISGLSVVSALLAGIGVQGSGSRATVSRSAQRPAHAGG